MGIGPIRYQSLSLWVPNQRDHDGTHQGSFSQSSFMNLSCSGSADGIYAGNMK